MTPFEIVMAVLLGMLIIWVIILTFWCIKASRVVTQHAEAMLSIHGPSGGPPGDWPPRSLDFP